MGSSPMFPNIQYNSSAYLINHLNIANTQKVLKIKLRVNSKIISSIKSLNSVGCISKFKLISNSTSTKNYAYVSTPFYKNTPFFKSIRLVSTGSKKHYLSVKALLLIDKTLKASILFLSTPFGIINHREAIHKKTGGLAMYIIH